MKRFQDIFSFCTFGACLLTDRRSVYLACMCVRIKCKYYAHGEPYFSTVNSQLTVRYFEAALLANEIIRFLFSSGIWLRRCGEKLSRSVVGNYLVVFENF